MDHLPKPHGSTTKPLLIPLTHHLDISHHYNRFHEVPERFGYGPIGRLNPQNSRVDFASFLQSWLYFGLVSAVVGDDAVSIEDFTVKVEVNNGTSTKWLSSAKLPGILDQWQKRLRSMGPATCDVYLDGVRQTLEYAIRSSLECDNLYENVSDQCAELMLAIKLLICTLVQVYNALHPRAPMASDDKRLFPLQSSSNKGSPAARVLMARMRAMNWCPQFIARICSSYDYGVSTYLSDLPRSRPEDHSQCTIALCTAYTIDEATYETKHTSQCDGCQPFIVDTTELVTIIEKGNIPLVRVETDANGNVSAKLSSSRTFSFYVAVSHVWADGLGNPRANSLPTCQLQRLNTDISRESRRNDLAFWIDTLCIPVDPNLRHIRQMAIGSMANIYSRAYRAHVIDAEMMSAITRTDVADKTGIVNDGHTDLLAHILCCVWNTRGWTYQEAVLAKRFSFDTGVGIINLRITDATFDSGLKQFSETRWLLWRMIHNPIKYLVRAVSIFLRTFTITDALTLIFRLCAGPQAWDKLVHPGSGSLEPRRAVHVLACMLWLAVALLMAVTSLPVIWFITTFLAGLVVFVNALVWVGKAFAKGTSTIPTTELLAHQVQSQLASYVAAEVMLSPSPRPRRPGRLPLLRFTHVWNAMSGRNSSKPGDLLITMASLTDMNFFQIANLKGPATRMRAIIGAYEELPLSLLFHPALSGVEGRDPLNSWLPRVPTGHRMPYSDDMAILDIDDDVATIRIEKAKHSYQVFELVEHNGSQSFHWYSHESGSHWRVDIKDHDACDKPRPTLDSQKRYCYLVPIISNSILSATNPSVSAAQFVVLAKDVCEVDVEYDSLVRLVFSPTNAPASRLNSQRMPDETVLRMPFVRGMKSRRDDHTSQSSDHKSKSLVEHEVEPLIKHDVRPLAEHQLLLLFCLWIMHSTCVGVELGIIASQTTLKVLYIGLPVVYVLTFALLIGIAVVVVRINSIVRDPALRLLPDTRVASMVRAYLNAMDANFALRQGEIMRWYHYISVVYTPYVVFQ